MKSSLQTLTRIQKFQIDEQRKILNEYLAKEEKILNDLKRMFLEYEKEKEFAAGQGYVGDFGAYTKRWLQYKNALEQALESVRQKIAEVRDVISDMFKEQKTYEIVDKNRKEREEKEEELKNQKTLDEIGTNAYIKRNKKTE